MLTEKTRREEESNIKTNITVDNFSKILADFDGENIPVRQLFINFELNASAYGLSEQQKYVQTRNKMIGSAKLFLKTVNVGDYEMLKYSLINEFDKTLNSNELHKMLSNRKKTESESFHGIYYKCVK